jgi:hypothetical protein
MGWYPQRQLTVAIRLFFDKADPVAIHTLAGAAYQILYDLSKGQGFTGFVKGNLQVREEMRPKWERILNRGQNFFKHADRDPTEKFEFEPEITRFFMFDAVLLYLQLTHRPFHEGTVYLAWFTIKYQEFLLESTFKNSISSILHNGFDPDDFDFIRTFLYTPALAPNILLERDAP